MTVRPLEWLIVGGGVHGTLLSHHLTALGGVPRRRIRVVDVHASALAEWDRRAGNCTMTALRSPGTHHLDTSSDSLMAFAVTCGRGTNELLGRHARPSLSLFRAHARSVIERNRLDELRLRARVTGLAFAAHVGRVETSAGSIAARRIVIAVGASHRPRWPDWARHLRKATPRIQHVFDTEFDPTAASPAEAVAVVGGGLTAAQLGLHFAAGATRDTILVGRRPTRVHEFDADAHWLENTPWCAGANPRARRLCLDGARNPGSVPPTIAREIRRARRTGALSQHTGDVVSARVDAGGRIRISLAGGEESIATDRLVLATGFDTERPLASWLADAARSHGLPLAPCGYPIVDARLRWRRNLHVAGSLAELQLGPFAPSIHGGRLSAQRLVAL